MRDSVLRSLTILVILMALSFLWGYSIGIHTAALRGIL